MIERIEDNELAISYKVGDSTYEGGGIYPNDTMTLSARFHKRKEVRITVSAQGGLGLLIYEEEEFDELCAVIDRIREWRDGR